MLKHALKSNTVPDLRRTSTDKRRTLEIVGETVTGSLEVNWTIGNRLT